MEPLTSGKYPESMQLYVGRRLPEFSKEEAELVRGSFDFIGLNYYTTNTARVATGYTDSVHHHPDLSTDPNVELGCKGAFVCNISKSYLFNFIISFFLLCASSNSSQRVVSYRSSGTYIYTTYYHH